jgi:excinuclease UvrABC nuclease subunit
VAAVAVALREPAFPGRPQAALADAVTWKAVAAALAALTARRDAAAGAQAYEAAARLQEEIAALDWVVAPQRVTTGTADEDVTGWAGDVLVRFRIRGGRLCGWEQRRGARPAEHTAGTWDSFVHRNAELAAVLSRSPVR